MTNRINTGIAIKYHGRSKWLPNQLTWQEDSIRVEISKNTETNTFFIIAPPFWFHYSTVFGVFQALRETFWVMLRLRRSDVVLTHSDVLRQRRKVMWCLPTSPQGETSLTQWTSLLKATSLARKGKHRSKNKSTSHEVLLFLEAPPGFEPGNKGFADLCLTTWLWRRIQFGMGKGSPILGTFLFPYIQKSQ